MSFKRFYGLMALGFSVSLAACSGEEVAEVSATTDAVAAEAPATAPAAPAPAAAEVPATGNVIEVKMITEGATNKFEPAAITAKPGDVVRFTLVSGVHNVSFPAAKNANAAGLPAASQYLTTPGQTFDVAVNMAPGKYEFVCDPHVAMGMVGTLTVAE